MTNIMWRACLLLLGELVSEAFSFQIVSFSIQIIGKIIENRFLAIARTVIPAVRYPGDYYQHCVPSSDGHKIEL